MRIKSKGGKVHTGKPITKLEGWAVITCTGRALAPSKWSEVYEGTTCKSCIKKAS